MLEQKDEYEKMARVEQEHWWYRALHHLVLDSIRTNTIGNQISIIDAGCGTGGLMLFLRQQGYTHLKGFDLSRHAVAICHERGLNVEQCDLREMAGRHSSGSADVIISNDTLYVLDEQERAELMEQCLGILRSGGLLILNVPALEAFRGIHDLSVEIEHRFSKSDLNKLIDLNKFIIIRELYWPFLLSPLVYCARFWQRTKMRLARDCEICSDTDLPSPWLNRILWKITLFENRWLPAKPFGSSLHLVLKKKPG